MTLIVDPKSFVSKEKLKVNLDTRNCVVGNFSIMDGWVRWSRDLPVGFRGVVTNHPLRTKYAEIERLKDGWIVK